MEAVAPFRNAGTSSEHGKNPAKLPKGNRRGELHDHDEGDPLQVGWGQGGHSQRLPGTLGAVQEAVRVLPLPGVARRVSQ